MWTTAVKELLFMLASLESLPIIALVTYLTIAQIFFFCHYYLLMGRLCVVIHTHIICLHHLMIMMMLSLLCHCCHPGNLLMVYHGNDGHGQIDLESVDDCHAQASQHRKHEVPAEMAQYWKKAATFSDRV